MNVATSVGDRSSETSMPAIIRPANASREKRPEVANLINSLHENSATPFLLPFSKEMEIFPSEMEISATIRFERMERV